MIGIRLFFKRYFQIRDFNYAYSLVLGSKLEEAQIVLGHMLSNYPEGVSTRLLLADTYLFQHRSKDALLEYKSAALGVEESKNLTEYDYIFLSAYINFRKLAIGYNSGTQEFPDWQSVAEQINKLPARKRFKRCFSLPTRKSDNGKL